MGKVMDRELRESIVTLHELQVEAEKKDIRGMTQGIALQTELELEASEIEKQIAETEDQIESTKKATTRYKVMTIVFLALCIITAVARYLAW